MSRFVNSSSLTAIYRVESGVQFLYNSYFIRMTLGMCGSRGFERRVLRQESE